jgi:hypothetical protein
MECDVCGHHATPRRTFYCPTCARLELYQLRMELAKALLKKEDDFQRVELVVSGEVPSDLPSTVLDGVILDTRDCARSARYQSIKSQTTLTKDRVEALRLKAVAHRSKLEEYKRRISATKSIISKKKSDAESANFGLDSRSTAEIDAAQKSLRRATRVWDSEQGDLIQWRRLICREAAKLVGLQKIRAVEGQSMREYYQIADSLPIFDLRDLTKADPATLTASLTQVAFLVSRISTYLALRLPAEICLPDNNQPLPIIYQPYGSYAYRESNRSSTIKSSFSNPHPRLLSLKTPLVKLAKDDQDTFRYFIEGVTLLAWNIAWICKVQGMEGLQDWTDVCNMGQNLWNLLLADNRHLGTITATKRAAETKSSSSSERVHKDLGNVPLNFGQYSHGTAHFFFGSNESSLPVRKWQLHTPTKIFDEVKRHIMSEMQGAEWEVVPETVWRYEDEDNYEQPVMVRARRPSATPVSGSGSERKVSKAGTSGWTKVRSRSDAAKDLKPSQSSDLDATS